MRKPSVVPRARLVNHRYCVRVVSHEGKALFGVVPLARKHVGRLEPLISPLCLFLHDGKRRAIVDIGRSGLQRDARLGIGVPATWNL